MWVEWVRYPPLCASDRLRTRTAAVKEIADVAICSILNNTHYYDRRCIVHVPGMGENRAYERHADEHAAED
jgi:hypothetical protein